MGQNRKRICVVVGTRPEAIKMAPVALRLAESSRLESFLLATGQHTQMLHQALDHFDLRADVDLNVMKERQTLDYLTAAVLEGVGQVLDVRCPDMVLVHGDTTTTFAASLAAFYRKIPVGHVEAGLRSREIYLPFPEEMNRLLTDRIATLWFAPTEGARKNLETEGVPAGRIQVTGNTVIDALLWTRENRTKPSLEALRLIPEEAEMILLTAHRRESWGDPLKRICQAAERLRNAFPNLWLLIPMHKNPAVREIIEDFFRNRERVVLCDPLDYPDFVWAMNRSRLILSDSGGVQEEASALRKPVLVLRELTERPEAVESGSAILVGTDEKKILDSAVPLLKDEAVARTLLSRCTNPFGDGHASDRIVQEIERFLGPWH
jgi:UDP-N-acetylglucosamine 2-epimerase (non-hydrolysing)